MNRRDALKTAAAGVAAMCGIKVDTAPLLAGMHRAHALVQAFNQGAMTVNQVRTLPPLQSFEAQITSIGWSGIKRRTFTVEEISRYYRVPVSMLRDLG